jgi:hypothetical protein
MDQWLGNRRVDALAGGDAVTRTQQIELRTEHRRKTIVMERLALPGEHVAGAAVVLLICLGGMALLALAAFVFRAMNS